MIGALPAFTSRRPARRTLGLAALALVSALAAAPIAPALARGPDSLADLSEQVIDAVVNISAASTGPANAENRRQIPMPQVPPGTPFEEFFEEFFRRGPGGGGQGGPTPPQQRRGNSLGSGFVIDSAGIVITNNHVIGEANDVTVIFNDGTRLKAEVVGKDSKVDLAVLRVKPTKPLKAVKFGDSTKMRVGDWVIAIGNPFGLGGSVSAGIVSARNRNIDSGPYDDYIQTDAAINKGNSGGPLFNMQGEVIGINTAILSPSGGSIGIGFAVPSAVAAPLASQLQEFGETRRGWLGVRIQQVDDALAEAMKLGRARGALIAGIDDKGPAKPAGLEAGDVIITFDGREIRDSRDLPRIVAATPVGKDVEVKIIRKGEEMTKTVKLARLEETAAASVSGRPTPPAAIPETKKVLGLETSLLTDDTRRRFNLKEGLKGVVVTRVDPNSPAADKRIQPGDVIVEFGEQAVNKPEDIVARVEALKKENKKSAVVVVANAQGETRFVALQLN